ncbi:MAG: sporulation transcription factor Spo0A [Clostridia bacterium]|nr:sporulation transcription factor Spo0A [Clostridia bacterium]
MSKKTIFILQDSKEFVENLKEYFLSTNEFDVVGVATDGIIAIQMIAEKKPQILITELVVSGYDGLMVINKIREIDKNIKILVLSAICRDEIVQKTMALGADYFIAKPCDFGVLKDRILEMNQKVSENTLLENSRKEKLDEKISKIFINVGIPPHIKGYSFLREGVKMAVNEPDIINNITKKLYPKIGEKFETTPSKVERAIRHAIEVAWNRGRIDSINNILGVRAYIGAEKPTNGEFIALVADKMLLERGQ